MNRQAALQAQETGSLRKNRSSWLRHAAVRPVAEAEHEGLSGGKPGGLAVDLTSVPVRPQAQTAGRNTTRSCPMSPQRCPFGGACHSCPPRVQAKLKIGQPGDKYELEADRVAEQVMRMPEPSVQRKGCSSCKGKEEDEEKILQAKSVGSAGNAPAQVDHPLIQNVLSSPGKPLDAGTRSFMEPRFGQDFSGVRVHTGGQAAESARAVNARAYTVGRNVVFGDGQYAPGSDEGKRLMAHELVHVGQQSRILGATSAPSGLIQRNINIYLEAMSQNPVDWYTAAWHLNGESQTFILKRLKDLGDPRRIAKLHDAALTGAGLGDCSKVALLTEADYLKVNPGKKPIDHSKCTPLDTHESAKRGLDPNSPGNSLSKQNPKRSNFQEVLTQNPDAAKAYKPIYAVTNQLIGYSRYSGGYSEVRNTDGQIVWSDEIPLEHGLPIIDSVLDLVESGLKQLGYVAVGTIDTVLENNWRALGLPVDEDHTQPIAKKLGIPLDSTAYTIGRGAGHALSILQAVAEMVGGATLFLSGAAEFMAGVATTPEGIGVVIMPVGVISMAGGAIVVIHGGVLGNATFVNMKGRKKKGRKKEDEPGEYFNEENAQKPLEENFSLTDEIQVMQGGS